MASMSLPRVPHLDCTAVKVSNRRTSFAFEMRDNPLSLFSRPTQRSSPRKGLRASTSFFLSPKRSLTVLLGVAMAFLIRGLHGFTRAFVASGAAKSAIPGGAGCSTRSRRCHAGQRVDDSLTFADRDVD